jgi:hypothetical protein
MHLLHLLAGNLLPGFVISCIKQRLDFRAAAAASGPRSGMAQVVLLEIDGPVSGRDPASGLLGGRKLLIDDARGPAKGAVGLVSLQAQSDICFTE